MATTPPFLHSINPNPLTQASSRLPDDTVFYSIYPDNSFSQDSLQSLHLQILNSVSPFVSSYIWQHEPFTLSISFHPFPHLQGRLRFGDNLNDEWFTVFLLFQISLSFPSLSIQVHDSDGEFLLIEAAYHLPRWLNPENSKNRTFIRRGKLHIIPKSSLANPTVIESLKFLTEIGQAAVAPDSIQSVIQSRIAGYPEKAKLNTHTVRVRVPVTVAQVLKHRPSLISLAVEGFYDRDLDSMKHAAKMEQFLKGGKDVEMVSVAVKMSRAMYAQLMQQRFQAPKCYPMPPKKGDLEAELGMKIACGFEMMYQEKKKEGEEGKGSDWKMYKESLEKSGYFKGLIPGSKEYNRLMEKAEEYYRNSSLFPNTGEMLNAPVRQIDEILSLPYSADDFKNKDIPHSDDDSWLYSGEEELNSVLLDRQKEMELYELKHKKKSKEQQGTDASSSSKGEDFDLSELVKTMQGFIHKVSSYEGAEVPVDRDPKEVELDVESFMKDVESVIKYQGDENLTGDVDEEGTSDMDFDESEDGSDMSDREDGEDSFMHSYSDVMNDELKSTTLKKSFVHANEQTSNKNEGTSNATEDMEEEFSPVDVDVNLVKNLLDSFSCQQGLPGPTSNLLGLMGVKLPKDDSKGK
ncbi:Protein SGT1-like protein [Hibiscus syriacus]|uniref:Protein SGT1-like protein n=1 Tax=Hibiscus syriacus TaxID=106335 RepID=A0A6A3AQM0_HIBSY|nr:protein ecdysoneless homolog isoform X1 [Hibiscus syriacus]KAE8706980.1 Protein SGT1-like protein [Hibiscus syriacus]